jgi:amino acid transporter
MDNPEPQRTAPPQRKVLARAVSFSDYVGIGLGSIIGVGWILVAGEWLTKGGPLGTVTAFLIGGLLIATIGKCYAELTPALPVAGGEVAFSYKAFGTGPAFMTGWFLCFGYVSLGPFETTSLGWMFELLIPSAKSAPLYTLGGFEVGLSSIVPGLAIGLYITILNYRGVKNSARFQIVTTVLLIGCGLIFISISLVKGSLSNLRPLFSAGESFRGGFWSIVAVMGLVPWFLAGFDTIPQVAEESGETVQPEKMGKAIVVSIIFGAVFYASMIGAVSLCMPWRESIQLEMPAAGVYQEAFGYVWATKLVLITGVLGLITSLNGIFIAATRVLFAAGRGGLIPRWFGEVHPRFHTPTNAIIFTGGIALAGPFLGRSILIPIVTVSALGYVCAWLITSLAAIRLRRTEPNLARPYRVKNTYTFYLATLISVILILLMILPGSSAQLKWPTEYLILAVWMALGYLGYLWRRSRKDLSQQERDYQILGDYR